MHIINCSGLGTILQFHIIIGDQQSGLFCNMTDDVKKICRSAYNVLQDTCNQIINGRIIMSDLKVINKMNRKFSHLCIEAALKDFSLEKWLGHLEATVKYIERIQEFHNLLDSRVQGKLKFSVTQKFTL